LRLQKDSDWGNKDQKPPYILLRLASRTLTESIEAASRVQSGAVLAASHLTRYLRPRELSTMIGTPDEVLETVEEWEIELFSIS